MGGLKGAEGTSQRGEVGLNVSLSKGLAWIEPPDPSIGLSGDCEVGFHAPVRLPTSQGYEEEWRRLGKITRPGEASKTRPP